MKKFLYFFVIFFATVVVAEEKIIENVIRVFMHDPGDYSVMVKDWEKYTVLRVKAVVIDRYRGGFFSRGISVTQELCQLPKGEKNMYVTAEGSVPYYTARIYITSEKVVEGGGFRRGDGSGWRGHGGKTSVVR